MKKEHDNVREKTIVITGASSGAGRCIALRLAEQRNFLVLVARNEEALRTVAEACREKGAEVITVPADVTAPEEMRGVVLATLNRKSRIDVWINNAGVLAAGKFDETPLSIHEQVIKTNLFGYMNGAHAVLPVFKQQHSGILINNISIGGYFPVPYGAGYSGSKFGLRGFSEVLKAELKPYAHIQVCDLFPAFLDTPGILHAGNYTGKILKPAPPVYDPAMVAEAVISLIHRPRSRVFSGAAALVLKAGHACFPGLTAGLTGWVMRRYFAQAKPAAVSKGNLFTPVPENMTERGGLAFSITKQQEQKLMAVALLAGFAAFFLNRK